MAESDEGIGSKLLKVGGVLADLVMHAQHATALLAVTAVIGTFAAGYIFQHVYLAVGALVAFAVLLAIFATAIVVSRRERSKDCSIAEAFSHLQAAHLPFETDVIRLSDLLVIKGQVPSENELADLKAKHEAYLAQLCATAAAVFAAKKRRKGLVAANIKRIDVLTKGGPAETYYKPLVHSYTDHDRLEHDERLEREPIRVRDNYMYRKMFSEDVTEDYFVHHDLARLIREFRKNKERAKEPDPDVHPNFYKSMMIYPISGRLNFPRELSLEPLLKYRDLDVFGLMCVDCEKIGTFRNTPGGDLDYDLSVMRQLTGYAFSSFRMVRAIDELSNHRRANPNVPESK